MRVAGWGEYLCGGAARAAWLPARIRTRGAEWQCRPVRLEARRRVDGVEGPHAGDPTASAGVEGPHAAERLRREESLSAAGGQGLRG